MKKNIAIVVVIIILGFIGFVFYQKIQIKINQEKQRPTKIVYNVGIIKAKKTLLKETVVAQALIEGNPQVKVYPNNITGIFVNNNVREGDYVVKDADIAYIDRNVPGSSYLPSPIKSPINGVVTKLYYIDAGSNVTLQAPVAEIANLNSVKIVVNLGEADLLKIKAGQPVTITSDYSKDINLQAKISSVTPFIDNDTFSGNATIFIDNAKRQLKIGMSVNVEIEIDQRDAFMIPESAVLMGQDKTYIYLNDNNTAKELRIQTGYTRDGLIEITGDIKDGDTIITDGNFKLYNAAQVKVLSQTKDNSESGNNSKAKYNSQSNDKPNPNYKKKAGK